MHHDLDKILDNVRSKYYCSKIIARPTISWSDEYYTWIYGKYDFYNNHITVSRLLNDERVTEEMLEYVIYHETIHQEINKHESPKFVERIEMFPEGNKVDMQLDEFMAVAEKETVKISQYNNFFKNKKKVVLVEMTPENLSEINNYFYLRDEEILIEFEVFPKGRIDAENCIFLFIAEFDGDYGLIGFATDGKLSKKYEFRKYSKYGDYDYGYQFMTHYESVYIMPEEYTYVINYDQLPEDYKKTRICVYDIDDPRIVDILSDIDSYRFGYDSVLMNPHIVNQYPEILDPSRTDELEINSFQHVFVDNWFCQNEPSFNNYMKRADDKYKAWLLSSALKDYIKANDITENSYAIFRIIQIAVLTERHALGREYAEKYGHLLEDNKVNRELLKALGL